MSYVDDRYRLAVQVYAMTHTALVGLNDAVTFKLFHKREVEDLQRVVAQAMLRAEELKNAMARELDATENA